MVNYSCVWTVEEYFSSSFCRWASLHFSVTQAIQGQSFFFSFPFHLGRHVIGWSSIQRLAVSVRNVRFRPSWAILSYLQPTTLAYQLCVYEQLKINFVFIINALILGIIYVVEVFLYCHIDRH
jgi:hypothetical protein